MTPALHVAQISFLHDPKGRLPEQLLRDWWSLVDIADCAHGAGLRVSVVQASQHSEQLTKAGIDYHFMPIAQQQPAILGLPVTELLQRLAVDVLHVHGLGFPQQVKALSALLPQTPILLQDHASQPPRWWRRAAWRQGCAAATGIAFCSLEQAVPFARVGILNREARLYAIPESSSRFSGGEREPARRECDVSGDPLVLWVGHLNANKDPLSMLDGISLAARSLPGLQLYCCFGSAPLMPKIRHRLAADPDLQRCVHLLGSVPHSRIETLLRAADVFVSASHREGSGYSLIEALACGLPPVVTDIPSFRELTAQGSIGALWPVGDGAALAQRLIETAARPRAALRTAVRRHFESELSFAAVGRKFSGAYHDLVRIRREQRNAALPAAHANNP